MDGTPVTSINTLSTGLRKTESTYYQKTIPGKSTSIGTMTQGANILIVPKELLRQCLELAVEIEQYHLKSYIKRIAIFACFHTLIGYKSPRTQKKMQVWL